MINILTRTSNRPKYFRDCIKSLESQTYKDWRLIISADDDFTQNYVNEYDYGHLYINIKGEKGAYPFNRYFNIMQNYIKEGWIIYYDDDVIFKKPESLEIIADHCKDEDTLVFWKYEFRDGRILPDAGYWKKYPQRKHIDSGCFAHHCKYRTQWNDARASDSMVVQQLYKQIPNKIWINDILIFAQTVGGGLRKDKK